MSGRPLRAVRILLALVAVACVSFGSSFYVLHPADVAWLALITLGGIIAGILAAS